MNNLLPIYFENCKPRVPRIDQPYNVRKPVFHLPKIKHKFAKQLPDYQLVKLLNENGSFRICSKEKWNAFVFHVEFRNTIVFLRSHMITKILVLCNMNEQCIIYIMCVIIKCY